MIATEPIDLHRARQRYRLWRITRDRALVLKAPHGRPLPMRTAPWLGGLRCHAVYYPEVSPITVHLWSHFETFDSVEAMLCRWVVDEDFAGGNHHGDAADRP